MYWTVLGYSDLRPVFRVLAHRHITSRVGNDVPTQTLIPQAKELVSLICHSYYRKTQN